MRQAYPVLTKLDPVVSVVIRKGDGGMFMFIDDAAHYVRLTPEEMLALAEEIRALALAGKETM